MRRWTIPCASPLWRERAARLRRAPAGGPTLALTLLAHLPALGHGSAKRVATLVGLAPRKRDSGPWRGSRAIWCGRRPVRAALSRAALVGVRHHPLLRAFYDQLLARGKPKKLALIAWMHQLLIILHAVLRDRTTWQST